MTAVIKRFSIGYDNHPQWTVPCFETYDEAFQAAGIRALQGDGPITVYEAQEGAVGVSGPVARCRREQSGGVVMTHYWGTLDTKALKQKARDGWRG